MSVSRVRNIMLSRFTFIALAFTSGRYGFHVAESINPPIDTTDVFQYPDVGCQNLGIRPDSSQTRGSVPIAAGPSTWCVPNLGSALAAARGERTVQTRCSSRNAFELKRYRTEESLHRLRRVGGDPHECQSNSMNLSQRHAADAAPCGDLQCSRRLW